MGHRHPQNAPLRPAALPSALVSLAMGLALASLSGASWGAGASATVVHREVSAAIVRVLRGEVVRAEVKAGVPASRPAPVASRPPTAADRRPRALRAALTDLPPPAAA